ncbi:protein mono-ADP-ribosyltransferase PARP14-like isoform X2 [Protopterus annectens]|uniref:protein mono-ADP-ribosyltransferase PARP14-like isoform X2 n=1 Tax=Protopterus annectens TaxID=7888 RepID=UPI001CFAE759|nr:protein mono-ADP-ribosyltransferase PARP14-like isoform X2 [Protopterus annectens]
MAEFSYCLLAESDTELDEKQKQTIERYFQVRRKSGGGDCKVCQLSQTLWEVSFLDPEAQKRVLEKREHLIKTPDGDILVTVKKDEKPWDNISAKPQKPTLQKAPSSENGEQLSILFQQTHAKLQDEINALDKAKISEKDKGTYSLSSSSVTDTECVIINGVNIDISLGNIVTETADVIVNSTNFFHGQTTGVAKAIFDAAGQAIVEQVKQGKMPPNRVFCTGPGNLKSIAIMHICCNNDLKIVEKAVMNVILECERRQYKSVAFPAIGTGQGGMESRAVANAMMNGVALATKTQSLTHLSTVRIVIYQKDTFQTFRETVISFVKERMQPREHSNLTGHSTSLLKSNKTTKPYGVQDNLLTSTSFLPAVFDLVGLSHDSVQKAKQELQFAFQKNYKETSIYDNQISSLQPDETHKLLADISESEAEITVCQGVNNKISVKGLVQDVDMASQVIHSILESKRENEMRDNKSKNKNPDVHETMNAKPKDSTPENGEPSDKSMVSNAGLHRPEFNKSLFASKDDSKVSLPVSSKAIDNEPQVGAKDVNEDKEMLKVSTSTNSKSKDKKSIANNILSRKSREDELKGKVSTVHDPENDRLMATGAGATNFGDTQSVSSTLTTQWYCKQDGEYVPFEKDTSLVIESEFAKRSKDVVIPFKGKSLIIDLERKEATILETTEVMKVKRVEERADGCLPLAWDEMPENNTSVNVELKKDSREYKDVECHFMETVKASKIVRIERVQNTQLWQQFEVWKKSMAAKNGPAEVKEKLLFHATVRGACNTINERGFNKDLQGQNGQYYGDGIYFTTDASVSANDKYSKMDENGLKYVYRARVLTGRFTKGKRGMRVPPLRTGTDLSNRYDSLVNKESKPTIFVVCNPYYSYPEYLIIFQKH